MKKLIADTTTTQNLNVDTVRRLIDLMSGILRLRAEVYFLGLNNQLDTSTFDALLDDVERAIMEARNTSWLEIPS